MPKDGVKLFFGSLRVDAALDRMAAQQHVLLPHRQPFAGRELVHLPDDVEPADELGDGVLDLDPGVHLEREELAVPVHEEFQSSPP